MIDLLKKFFYMNFYHFIRFIKEYCWKSFMSAKDKKYDSSIIRPEMLLKDVRLRREHHSSQRLRKVKAALITLHTLETMAVNIYKFMITDEESDLNRQLIAAMCNEMTHMQDFQVKLYEFGWKPSKLRWAYWIVGFVFGYGSRLIGKKTILKTGIWVETKAVHHYAELLKNVDWDEETRRIVEKDQSDENGHINRWKTLLKEMKLD